MIEDVLAEDDVLLHVLTLAVHHSGPFLFSELFCGTPPSCLKVMGGWWVGCGWVVGWPAPVPFGLIWVSNWVGLGWDWVWRDWGLMGLTIFCLYSGQDPGDVKAIIPFLFR